MTQVQGFLRIAVEPGKEKRVAQALGRVPGVSEVVPMFGEFDFVAKLQAPDYGVLADAVRSHIRTMDGVRMTDEMLPRMTLGPGPGRATRWAAVQRDAAAAAQAASMTDPADATTA